MIKRNRVIFGITFTVVVLLLLIQATYFNLTSRNSIPISTVNSKSPFGHELEEIVLSKVVKYPSIPIKDVPSMKKPSTHDQGNNYVMKGYHRNTKNNFIVFQKCNYTNLLDERDDFSHFWNLANEDIYKPHQKQFNIKVIESYDYNKIITHAERMEELNSNSTYMAKIECESNFIDLFKNFFKKLYETLHEARPRCEGLNNDEHYHISEEGNKYVNENGRVPQFEGNLREQYLDEPIRTKQYLQSFLRLSENEVNCMSSSHNNFIEHLGHDWPKDLVDKYNNFNDFMKGDGYIFLAKRNEINRLILSIKALRSNGAKLPIEVIVPSQEEYNFELCNTILPAFGGKCKLLTLYLPNIVLEKLQTHHLKALGLIISSFENVLYLDIDTIPVKNPDSLFVNKPFTNKHLVLWPDHYRRSTSPYFYKISNMKVNEEQRARNSYFLNDPKGSRIGKENFSYHDLEGTIPETTNSGHQLLINKRFHFKTLMLSFYYNFYGSEYYYPLLNQGGAAEDDKDTYITAAHKLGLPYYQVKEFNREFGPLDENKHHKSFGVGQYDPIVDYIQSHEEADEQATVNSVMHKNNKELHNKNQKNTNNKRKVDFGLGEDLYDFHNDQIPTYGLNSQDPEKNNYNYHFFKASNLFFIRAEAIKFDDLSFFENQGIGLDEKRQRCFGKGLVKELDGYDFELTIMKNLHWLYCEELRLYSGETPLWNTESSQSLCQEINSQILFLKKDTV